MNKARVIERSLNVFTLGWFSLIPLLGVVPALLAIYWYRKSSDEAGMEWNPAGRYALCGCVLALAGLALSLLGIGGALAFAIYRLI